MPEQDADAVVVGAGPGGSAAAYHLARHGARVLLLEKSELPREKVCGDGLTPRGVRQLIRMGVDVDRLDWPRNRGLRAIGGGVRLELDWPALSSFPNFGLTRSRYHLDQFLAHQAVAAGARLYQGHRVTAPVFSERTGQVVGVTATVHGEPLVFRAPIVIAADGAAGRLPIALGATRRKDRPLGVAVRRYYHCPAKHDDEYLESWLELPSQFHPGKLLSGYGWIFGMGDGRVNAGVGVLNPAATSGDIDYRRLLAEWLGSTPDEWGLRDEATADGPAGGAALPMGFSRVPHYLRGAMLVGDAGGMVNPFTGEGIAYAMEAGEIAAETAVAALAQPDPAARERALRRYPALLRARHGGFFRLGVSFGKLIGHPWVMRTSVRYGLSRPTLMRFLMKLLSHLTEPRGGDAMDRIINALVRVTPTV